jgi:hypothetical protein
MRFVLSLGIPFDFAADFVTEKVMAKLIDSIVFL